MKFVLRAFVLSAFAVVLSCGEFDDGSNANAPMPAPSSVSPNLGSTQGGQLVAIHGASFSNSSVVLFGGSPAVEVSVVSESVITAKTPAHAEGTVDVEVINSRGRSAIASGAYQYVAGSSGTDQPRLLNAMSTSNTTIRASFSVPVAAGAEDAVNYSVTHANVNSESGVLPVLGAKLSADGITVELTTASQNAIQYKLTVANIRARNGSLLAAPELLVDPTVTTFNGTGPTAGSTLVDTDDDGLSDNAELLGWTITVYLSNGDISVSTQSSDPNLEDTDGDGLRDSDERLAGSNPRSADTDADGLSDYDEWNVWWSDPTRQDTDGDTLPDSFDVFFGLSPTLADTDGDGYDDYAERFTLNRNPLIADLPRPRIAIGSYDMTLNVEQSYTDESGVTHTSDTVQSSSISQAQASAQSRSDTRSTESENRFSQSLGTEIGYSTADGFAGSVTASVGFEQSRASGYSSSISSETARQSQQTYDKAVAQGLATSQNRSVTRNISGANMSATITIANQSNVPFTLQNLEISVLRQDRTQLGAYRPVATLLPASGAGLSLNLAPYDAERGPIIFQNSNIFPNVVDELLREPAGLVFKVANFDVLDEDGRNFAYSYATVTSRTAGVTIDFGNGVVETYRVATASAYDLDGNATGISITRALEILGYGVTQDDDTLPATLPNPLPRSISATVGTKVDATGVERLVRVGGVQNSFAVDDAQKRFWAVQTNNTNLSANSAFSDIVFRAGQEYLLMYTQDIDRDQLFDREELSYGSSDFLVDSDSDGLDDYFEVRTGWGVRLADQSYVVFPSPSRPDSDLDGLSDAEERAAATDPNRADTDSDGVLDLAEVRGEVSIQLFDGDADDSNDVFLTLAAYSDYAMVSLGGVVQASAEGDDEQFVANGTLATRGTIVIGPGENGVIDTEGTVNEPIRMAFAIAPGADGICDTTAATGDLQITAVGSAVAGDVRCVYAGADDLDTVPAGDDFVRALHAGLFVLDPSRADTDMDGLPDGREIVVGTNPNSQDAGSVVDSDNDGLYDSEELAGWLMTVNGVQTRVTSNPSAPDTDLDGVPDVYEFAAQSNPRAKDTDGDGLADGAELDSADTDDYYDDVRWALALSRCSGASACRAPTGTGHRTKLTSNDSDGDGRTDRAEIQDAWTVTATSASGTTSVSVRSLPYSADADLDGLNDAAELAATTNPNVADTDDDGTNDGTELRTPNTTTHRNPLRADRYVTVSLPSSARVDGDCDPGTDGGDFEGSLQLTDPNGSQSTIYNVASCAGVSEGSTCGGTPAQRSFFVYAGQNFSYDSTAIVERDSGSTDEPVGTLPLTTVDYTQIVTWTTNTNVQTVRGSASDCSLTFNITVTVQ